MSALWRYACVVKVLKQKSIFCCNCYFLPFFIDNRNFSRIMEEKLASVPNVQIDVGKFKYILMKVYDGDNEENSKFIVRGTSAAPYHADIYDVEFPKIEKLGLCCECVGGGRILHNANEKTIHVYGYSQGFGQADHSITVKLLKERYTDYSKIDHSNGGY